MGKIVKKDSKAKKPEEPTGKMEKYYKADAPATKALNKNRIPSFAEEWEAIKSNAVDKGMVDEKGFRIAILPLEDNTVISNFPFEIGSNGFKKMYTKKKQGELTADKFSCCAPYMFKLFIKSFIRHFFKNNRERVDVFGFMCEHGFITGNKMKIDRLNLFDFLTAFIEKESAFASEQTMVDDMEKMAADVDEPPRKMGDVVPSVGFVEIIEGQKAAEESQKEQEKADIAKADAYFAEQAAAVEEELKNSAQIGDKSMHEDNVENFDQFNSAYQEEMAKKEQPKEQPVETVENPVGDIESVLVYLTAEGFPEKHTETEILSDVGMKVMMEHKIPQSDMEMLLKIKKHKERYELGVVKNILKSKKNAPYLARWCDMNL